MALGPPNKLKRNSSGALHNRVNKLLSIALIDERPVMRHFFGRWLEENARDAHIVTIASPAEVVDNPRLVGEFRLVVFSIGAARIADPGVVDTIHEIGRSLPDIPIILLSDHDDLEEVAKAIRQGVRGYVSTKLELSDLAAAIYCVEAGSTFVPAGILMRYVQHQRAASKSGSEVVSTLRGGLTPREMEVVARLRLGKPNKVIAYELKISESTVKAFVRRILIKLNALNRTEVAHLTEGQFDSIQAALNDCRSPQPANGPDQGGSFVRGPSDGILRTESGEDRSHNVDVLLGRDRRRGAAPSEDGKIKADG